MANSRSGVRLFVLSQREKTRYENRRDGASCTNCGKSLGLGEEVMSKLRGRYYKHRELYCLECAEILNLR